MQSLERKPGTYALILSSSGRRRIRVGRLGILRVRPGFYVYLGSAFGPGGVGARVAHHKKRSERLHWHIDYLTRAATLQEVWYCYDATCREHEWAAALAQARGATVPMRGFGASDCRCDSHLIFFEHCRSPVRLRRRLEAAVPIGVCSPDVMAGPAQRR